MKEDSNFRYLSLYLTKDDTMKTYGGVEIQFHSFISSAQMDVIC